MKLRSAVVVALLALQIMNVSASEGLTKISDSVYSYVGVPAETPLNAFSANAGIIIGKEFVVVVDTLTSAKEAETFVKDIKAVTNKPIRYVINTHYHLDHALGNNVFADMGATIIAHNECKNTIVKNGDKVIESPKDFGLPENFWEGTRIAAPTIAFDSEMVLDLDGLTVKLIHTGVASHSAGSIIVHIPEQDVIFTGDILFTDFHPYLGEGDFPGWQKTLDIISAMNVKNIIPGHGPLSTNKDLSDMKSYLTFFDKNAKELCANESDPKKVADAMLKILPKKANGDFIVGMNIGVRYAKKAKE